MLAKRKVRPNAYDLLVVDPNAPSELIATSYWSIVGGLQKRRERGEYVDDALHELTRAYERISDSDGRSGYDEDIGNSREPLTKRKLPGIRRSLRSRLFRWRKAATAVDCYEVLGISPVAPAEIVPAAYRIMRDQYLRIPDSKKRMQLLRLLENAYDVVNTPEKRKKYDERTRPGKAAESAGVTVVTDNTATTLVSAPAPAGAAVAPAATPANERRAQEQTWTGGTLRGLGRVLLAIARLSYRGLALALRSVRNVLRNRSNRRSAGPAAAPPVQRPPIVREPPPRPKGPVVDVEEALLGRLASSVKETYSRPGGAEHTQNHD